MVQSAFEVGLHKERYYREGNATSERSGFLKGLMACVVDLDKRCSFMVNLPHHLHDREIDDSVLDLVRRPIYTHKPKLYSHAPSETMQLTSVDSTGVTRSLRQWFI